MRKKTAVQYAFLALIIAIASCSDKKRFTVEVNLKDGKDKTLYFENVTTSEVIILDSAKLNKSGSFTFKSPKPDSPDFYRLRLKNQFINFSAEETEKIKIQADTVNFARNYSIEGSSESEKIKELTFLQLSASEAYNKIQKQFDSKKISADEYVEKSKEAVAVYKNAAYDYIYSRPESASAYFALFQQINKLLIFDPYDKKDSQAYGAVANNWNQFYPESARTQHLVAIFKRSLAVLRGERQSNLEITEVESKNFLDFALPTVDDKEIRLSEAGEGKVVIIDFTAYELSISPDHNSRLLEIYNKYKSKGLQIFQVSLDNDPHFWKNAAVNLPWICVIDPQSIYSEVAKKYNVNDIPVSFIRNKEGEIVKRIENYDSLEAELLPFLK
jgi:peroxiredoxin